MRALRIHGVREMRLEEVDEPRAGPGEVLVRVLAAGICGTDIEVLHGLHGAYRAGIARLPITPGHEWAGVVEQVGDGVGAFRPGQLVTGETGIGCLRCKYCLTGHHNLCPNVVETGIFNRDGAMRELHVHPEIFTHSAEGLEAEQAALVEPATVAVHACRRGRVSFADRVAVLGCGPIGLLAIQAARVFGARYVLATSRSEPKLRLAEELGADRAVNVARQDLLKIASEVTGGEGFDVVLECSGSLDALDQALDIAGRLGRVVVVGVYRGEPFGRDVDRILGKELEVIGSVGSPHVWPETIDMIRRDQIRVDPVISHRFPLSRWQEAFELAERGGPDVLKILLLPQE